MAARSRTTRANTSLRRYASGLIPRFTTTGHEFLFVGCRLLNGEPGVSFNHRQDHGHRILLQAHNHELVPGVVTTQVASPRREAT